MTDPERAAAAAAHHARAGASSFAEALLKGDPDAHGRDRAQSLARRARGVVLAGQALRRVDGRAAALPSSGVEVARAYTIPTDAPESDGTLAWDTTTLVVVEVAGGRRDAASATPTPTPPRPQLIRGTARRRRRGRDALDVARAPGGAWSRAVRNLGRPGIASMAISAVDAALWDLKAQAARPAARRRCSARRATRVPVYGSGGFTSYSDRAARRRSSAAGSSRASRA